MHSHTPVKLYPTYPTYLYFNGCSSYLLALYVAQGTYYSSSANLKLLPLNSKHQVRIQSGDQGSMKMSSNCRLTFLRIFCYESSCLYPSFSLIRKINIFSSQGIEPSWLRRYLSHNAWLISPSIFLHSLIFSIVLSLFLYVSINLSLSLYVSTYSLSYFHTQERERERDPNLFRAFSLSNNINIT